MKSLAELGGHTFGSPNLHNWMIFLDRALHPRYWSEAAQKIKAAGC